ncbi:STAS domain-containing protein [Rubripirellula sp.]|jgi:anti-anti-sigma factor|nr:STAS domain-containing protein [Rubripirellula sp.]MDF1842653.1 STAS domain-containing protein [Rubripirellula sp.]
MTSENSKSLVTGTEEDGAFTLTIQVDQIRDPTTSTALRNEMINLVDPISPKCVIVNFENVQFMGSIGFLALMALRRHLADSRMVLCGLSQSLMDVFELCGLVANDANEEVKFEVAENEQAARQAFQS